jgi:hypothetical protein
MDVKICPSYLREKHAHERMALENRVRRKIFVLKRAKVTGIQKKLHNEELHNLYFSTNIIWMVKSRSKMWTKYIELTTEKCVQNFGWKF